MTEAETVVPDATQNNAVSEPAPIESAQPEVAEPETVDQTSESEEAGQAPEPLEKTVKRLNRRLEKVLQQRAVYAAEAEQARREAEALRTRTQQYSEEQQQPQVDPVVLANEIASIREATARSNKVAEDGAKKFGRDEFSKAVNTVIEEAGPLVRPIAPGVSVGKPTPLGEAILEADDPAAVLHYLGSNPDVASELNGLSPLQVAKRVARIEIELSKPREPKVSNAPKPVTPVKATSGSDNDLSSDLPLAEWMRRREEQLKAKRR